MKPGEPARLRPRVTAEIGGRMLYNENARCEASISALGVGTWSMGGTNAYGLSYGDVTDDASIAAIHALVDGGVNLVDTAPVYGGDHASEKVVGAALAQDGYRDKVIPAMAKLRSNVDAMEKICSHEYWPVPSYNKMLFYV